MPKAVLVITSLLVLAFTAVSVIGLGSGLEYLGLDVFRIPHQPHPNIVILAIDNQSLERVGRWPWDRAVHAEILDRLSEFSPRTVAYDINFFERQDQENDIAFAHAIANAPFPVALTVEPVYLRGSADPQRFILPLPELINSPNIFLGHVKVPDSVDGMARNFPKILRDFNNSFFPFGLVVFQSVGGEETRQIDYVDFAGSAGSFPTYPVSALLAGELSSNELGEKIVLIGATASDLRDFVSAPVSGRIISGVEWHANVIDNLLTGRGARSVPAGLVLLVGWLLAYVYSWLYIRVKTGTALFLAFGFGVCLVFASFGLWLAGLALPYFWTLNLLAAIFIAQSFYRWFLAEAEKRRLRKTMQHYFSPQVMQLILQNPDLLKLGGDRRRVTVLFSDIRSFTTITEKLDPEILSRLLHEYFTEMTEAIMVTDGVLDKFIGDAIMAFWGAPLEQPDQADRAVTAALGMMNRLKKLQDKWRGEGLPEIDIGIGISTGIATVGNMGSEKRFDYTAIGDSVNIAARLEGLNKEYSSHIIIAESTKKKLITPPPTKELGEVLVKGKNQPIKIFEIVV